MQPCTCYYPDHPNVPIFELGTDEITKNATIINGTGPSNCQDLQKLGYSLKGFHIIVLFNSKRIKTIYCDFDQTNENTIQKVASVVSSSTKQKDAASVSSEVIQFCNGIESQSCKFLYPDYPDISLFDLNSTDIFKNVSLKNYYIPRPASCEDLNVIGYYLKGFYLVSLNAKKVKIIFCDFNEMGVKNKKLDNRTQHSGLMQNNISKISRLSTVCNDYGSQPCSCYYSNFPDVLQLELSNDEVTRFASKENGTGPEGCEDLKHIGHTLDGFYFVRFKTNIIKTVYCMFNYSEQDENKSAVLSSAIQSTLKPRKRKILHIVKLLK